MKILHFISSLGVGGAENLIMNYSSLLREDGHQVEILVLTHKIGSYIESFFETKGIKVYYMDDEIRINKSRFAFWKFKSVIRIMNRIKFLKKFFTTNKYDVIHMHTGTYIEMNRIGKKYYNKTKLFYTCHTEPLIHFHGKNKNIMKKMIKKGIKIISLNNEYKIKIDSIFSTKCIVLGNGVLFDKFKNVDKKNIASIAKDYNLGDKFIIGNVGRFVDVKNHLFIIDIFNEVKKEKKNSILILIGDGELKNQIVSRIKDLNLQDSVIFFSNRSDVQDIMSLFDVYLMPSKYEGFPISLIESQVLGIKCVVSNNIPLECIVNTNIQRISLNEGVNVWSNAIIEGDYSKSVNDEINKFDLKTIVQKLIEIYNE